MSWQRSAGSEQILAAPPSRCADDPYHHLTFRSHDAGVADLTRLQLFAVAAGGRATMARLSDSRTRVTSIVVHNAHQRLRGRYEVAAPAGVFSTARRQVAIDLGSIRLDAGDTLELTLVVGGDSFGGAVVAGALPFRPDHGSTSPGPEPQGVAEPHVYVAAMPVVSRAFGSFWSTLIFEEHGVVDLDSLQLAGTVTTHTDRRAPRDALPAAVVEAIRLPSGENLIVGNLPCSPDSGYGSGLAVPSTLFGDRGRMGSWLHLGRLAVRRGHQIVIGLRRLAMPSQQVPIPAVYHVGLRFYPENRVGGGSERVRPSDFFEGSERSGTDGTDPCICALQERPGGDRRARPAAIQG